MSSSNGLARPTSTLASSGRPARNSSATRLLPIPGSPYSVTRCPRLASRAPSNASNSSRSSRLRFTSGIVRRDMPGWSRRPDRPRGVVEALRLDLHDRPVLDLRLREPIARLGDEHAPGLGGLLQPRGEVHGGPVEQPLLGGLAADRDRPRVDPDPDAQGDREPVLLPELADAVDEREPGADGPGASSSWVCGIPKTPTTASPAKLYARPRSEFELVGHDPVVAVRTSRYRSGSMRAESWVEPTRSTKMTVTTLRSSGALEPTGYPQFGRSGPPREQEPAPFTRRHRHGRESTDAGCRPGLRSSGSGAAEAFDVEDRAGADPPPVSGRSRRVRRSRGSSVRSSTRWISTASAPTSRIAPIPAAGRAARPRSPRTGS